MSSSANAIPPPSPLKIAGDVAADWEWFRFEFENSEIATRLAGRDAKKRVFLAAWDLLREPERQNERRKNYRSFQQTLDWGDKRDLRKVRFQPANKAA